MNRLRIGHGFDVHPLVDGRALIIGGVKIPFARGLEGHSDGDVLLHAIMDALLGAAGLPDIGQHFPPGDAQYQNADSSGLLQQVQGLINDAGFGRILNIDSIIIAQKPRMSPHIPAMREKIAWLLETERSLINVKATTTEKLGFVGREDGIAASAVCLISSDE